MKKKILTTVLLATIFILGFALAEGYLDIPQTAQGVVIQKEHIENGDFGKFTIKPNGKWIPKKVYYSQMEYSAFEIGEEIIIHYKVSLLPFREAYGVGHEKINN